MDIASLTATAAALLAPYFATLGDEVAKHAGQSAWTLAESLYATIRRRFAADQDAYAEQTLQRLAEQPTHAGRQAALATVLQDKAQTDPHFAEELTRLVHQATQAQGAAQFLTQVYDQAEVGKIVNIGQAGSVEF